MSTNLSLTPSQLPAVFADMARIGRTINISGSPGIGKSQCVEQFVKTANLHLVDIRLSQYESVDLNGFAVPEAETKKMTFLPVDLFILEGEDIPDGKAGVCLFLDEFNAANRDTASAAYKVVLEQKVGNVPLHEKTIIIAAGNLKTDRAIVNDMGTAMQSKLINVELSVSTPDWLKWAVQNGIDQRVISFIKGNPGKLHVFDPKNKDLNFGCPRTWEFLSKYIDTKTQLNHVDLIVTSGCVGEGLATEFKTFCNIYRHLPTIDTIKADPSGFAIKQEPSWQFAISTLISHHIEDAPSELLEALSRFPTEFQVVCLREAIARNKSNFNLQPVQDWCALNSDNLFE